VSGGTEPSNLPVAVANVVLFGFGHGMAAWPLYRIWSVELFPTPIRSIAQGVITGIIRIALGFWSFVVPVLAATGFETVALILALLLTYCLVVGLLFTPNTGGKTLETIQEERSEDESA
jgi:inositol transporter-like SP family MFS transporter